MDSSWIRLLRACRHHCTWTAHQDGIMCDRDAQLCRVICPCSFLAKQRACLHSDGARSLYQNWLGKRSHLCSARCGCSASATGSTTQRPTVLTDRSKMHGKQPRRTQPIPESWSASNAIHRSSLQYWCCQCSRRTRARGQPLQTPVARLRWSAPVRHRAVGRR